MTVIDLNNAYFHVPIHQKYKDYLQFKWQGWIYPQNIYKIDKTSDGFLENTRYQISGMSRWYPHNGTNKEPMLSADKTSPGISNKIRLANQLRQIKVGTQPNKRIPRVNNRVIQHEVQGTKSKIKEDQEGSKLLYTSQIGEKIP